MTRGSLVDGAPQNPGELPLAVSARGSGDDSSLVRAVQAGDLEAYSELFRRHHPAVQRACARRMASPLDAEEVAQAAFVRALERIGQCGGEREFGGWVQTIARHLCVDSMRGRLRVVPHEAPVSADHSDGAEPDHPLLDRERRDDVRRALDTLPPRQRQAVTARAEGTGPGQIADDLGLSVGAVDSLILRGRRRLALAYQRVAGEGGAAATATSAAAAALLLAVVSIGSTRLLGGVAAAAEAGRDLVRPVASGVTGAIMAVAVVITGSGPAATPEPTSTPGRPPAVVVGEPLPEPAGAVPGGVVPGGEGIASGTPPTVAAGPAAQPSTDDAGVRSGAATVGTHPGGIAGGAAAGSHPSGVGSTGGVTPDPTPGPGSGPPTPPTALPIDGLEPAVVDPVVDAVDATLPAVGATVSDTAQAVGDTVDALAGLLPK